MDPEEYKVHGTVTDAEGRELSYADVIVWWQRIRERLPLATGRTSEEGHYQLNYRPPDDAPGKLLIVVEVRSEHLKTSLESALTNAQPDLQIDLAVQPRDQSEFALLLHAIEPLLDSLMLLDVVENTDHQDISFLSQETGYGKEQVMRVVVSARLQAAFSLPDQEFNIPAAAYYAFIRQHVPSAIPSSLLEASQGFTLIDSLVRSIGSMIFALSTEVQKRTLETAVQENLVGQRLAGRIPAILDRFQALRTTDILRQPYQVGKTTLGQLLDVAQLDKSKQETFAQALASNTQSMRNFWRTLGDGKHGLNTAEASAVERTLEVGAFVKNHLPLIQVLLQSFTSGTYTSLSSLARLSLQDWVQLVNRTGPPPSIDGAGKATPAEVFARVIYTRVTRAFPTAALSSRIATGNLVPQTEQQPLIQFFQNNPDLELIKDNIPAYLANKGAAAFTGISEKDQPVVVANTRSFQRVLRVAPNTDAAQNLLGQGIRSATQIATLGKQQFFLKATEARLTRPEANRVYQVAAQRYAAVVSLYMQLNIDAVGVWPQLIGDLADLNQAAQQAIQRDQSLATLFGSQDYCAIDDCTSVLSPAAYLCDLLLWLRNHPQGTQTALDVLDDRRPDIRHLLLNCPNTDTELPYIDLVNELLADKISPPTDPTSTINPIWKQTSDGLTTAQLSAAPQYFNQEAYVTLFSASYPQTLPYSTGLDELRTYLQQWKLPLWQLRQALLPVGGGIVAQQAQSQPSASV